MMEGEEGSDGGKGEGVMVGGVEGSDGGWAIRMQVECRQQVADATRYVSTMKHTQIRN